MECPNVGNTDRECEPYGREAKFFTEHYLLNRDVQVVIEGTIILSIWILYNHVNTIGVDQYNFYGTISYAGKNIGEELLKNGLGKYVNWSGQRNAFSEQLRAAEKYASY